MDNIFEIEQIRNDLYRSIVRMEKCTKRMCEVQEQKPNDYNNDETYREADLGWYFAYGSARAFAHALHHLTNENEKIIYQDAYNYVIRNCD